MLQTREEWSVSLGKGAYRAYRKRQARALLDLVPREALRELYGAAREWARERGAHDVKDPMSSLLAYCEEILPLPPLRVWARDADHHASHHLRELGDTLSPADGEGSALPLETRSFVVGSTRWYAALGAFHAGGAWRGHLTFHRGPGTPVLRTAAIFREDAPEAIRRRFKDFEEPALRAFLRSVSS